MDQPTYVVDPKDPRAPPHDVWEQLTPSEQERIIETLPVHPPITVRAQGGDQHREARTSALDTIGAFFRRVGRKVYLSSGLSIYYPGIPCIVPDIFAVLQAEPHARMKWVVDKERRGLDFVLEMHIVGDDRGEHERNLELYASLGITEYFLFDRRQGLRGYRLAEGAEEYQPILPQGGRFASEVLLLDLTFHNGKLRFFHGTAPLLRTDELVAQLESMVDELTNEKAEAERTIESLGQAALRERERADRAERVNAKVRGELARLKGEV